MKQIVHVERSVTSTGAPIRHGGNMACYVLSQDEVRVPPFESFRDPESYNTTLAHELTHWAATLRG